MAKLLYESAVKTKLRGRYFFASINICKILNISLIFLADIFNSSSSNTRQMWITDVFKDRLCSSGTE